MLFKIKFNYSLRKELYLTVQYFRTKSYDDDQEKCLINNMANRYIYNIACE